MDIRTHLYSSALLGGSLYAATQSAQVSIAAFLSGIFVDIDHVSDFLIFSDEKFSIKNVFSWCDDGRWEKIALFFHSYELYFILITLTYYSPHNILIGILLGTGLHIILDQIGNCYLRKNFSLSLWFYFLTYRILVGFHKDKLRTDNLNFIKDS